MIKLYKGDCLIEMKNIQNYSVDFILTDLPYGTTACSWDAIIPFEPMWKEFYRILRPNGFIALTASQPFTTKLIASNIDRFSHQWIWQKEQGSNPLLANKMPMKNFEDVLVFGNEHSHDFTFRSPLREYAKMLFKYIGKKKKEIFADMGNQSVCHFMRTASTQFNLCTEKCYNDLTRLYGIDKMDNFIEFETLKTDNLKWLESFPRVYNPQMTEGKEYVSGGGYVKHLDQFVEGGNVSSKRYPTSIIEFATGKSKSVHPTQKPTALLEYLIKTYTNEGMTVFDATMGSGSTMVACKNTNRNGIGIEMNDEYFSIAEKRVGKNIITTGKQETLFNAQT